MGITRGQLTTDHFTTVPNHWARTNRLSYKAKGLLLAIASHAAGYRLTMEQLIAESSESRTAVRSGLNELEAGGYLVRERLRDPETGRLGAYEWYLVEDPHNEHQGTKPDGGTDQGVDPVSAGRTQGTFSTGGSRPPKKNTQEDHQEDQVLGGSVSPQTPPANAAPKKPEPVRRERAWRPRVPQTIKDRGPAAVAEYVNAKITERERIKQAKAEGKVPF